MKLQDIIDTIEQTLDESDMSGYHRGFDEAWDEARNKGYDDGYDDAKAIFFDKGYDEAKKEACILIDEAHHAGYDEGYDTALTCFEADERIETLIADAEKTGFEKGYKSVSLFSLESFMSGKGAGRLEAKIYFEGMLVDVLERLDNEDPCTCQSTCDKSKCQKRGKKCSANC